MNALQPVPGLREQLVDATNYPRHRWWDWFNAIWNLFKVGFTGTITTAKLTPGGANGSMTFQNGVLISQVAAT